MKRFVKQFLINCAWTITGAMIAAGLMAFARYVVVPLLGMHRVTPYGE